MTILKIVKEGLRGITLPSVIRPPVEFDSPNKELALFATRLYAYSSVAHIRTILAGITVLYEDGNIPSAKLLARHMFEWVAHIAYITENLTKHAHKGQWKDAFEVISNFDRANSWIKNHGDKHGAAKIQLDAPKAVRLGRWIEAYERFRTKFYGKESVNEVYGFLSEHAHPSASCLLQYRDFHGAEILFVESRKTGLSDLDHCLIDWLMLHSKLLALAQEDTVRLEILEIIKTVASLQNIDLSAQADENAST